MIVDGPVPAYPPLSLYTHKASLREACKGFPSHVNTLIVSRVREASGFAVEVKICLICDTPKSVLRSPSWEAFTPMLQHIINNMDDFTNRNVTGG